MKNYMSVITLNSSDVQCNLREAVWFPMKRINSVDDLFFEFKLPVNANMPRQQNKLARKELKGNVPTKLTYAHYNMDIGILLSNGNVKRSKCQGSHTWTRAVATQNTIIASIILIFGVRVRWYSVVALLTTSVIIETRVDILW